MNQSWLAIIVSLMAVVFVFLFAVKKFSRQIEYLAQDRLKNILARFTNTPIKGAIVGAGVTSILQSSTAVTVMLVSLVDAGLLSFGNSLGVIIGTNVGTTITTQLVAFKLLNLAPYILVIGFILMNTKTRYQRFGKSVFYFGLIFSCLFIVSVLSTVFGESELFLGLIAKTSNVFIAIAVGFLVVTVLQSSSIATSMIVIFASGGLLSFVQALGLILGINIGTTTTALLASIVTGKQGKRVALAHFIFNFFGVLIFLPFFDLFTNLIYKLNVSLPTEVALSHLIFNLIIAVIFLLAIKPFSRLVERVIK